MKIKKILQTLAIAILLLAFLLFTNPNKISLPFILVPYLLFGFIIYRVISFSFNALFDRVIGEAKLKLYSIIITVLIMNFALLKSIGQLTVQDGLISAAIVVVSVIYISKFSFAR